MSKRIKAALAVLLMALGIAVTASPASAAPSKYDRWMNEIAVTVSVDGVQSTFTERQVGAPAFQAQMKQRLDGGVTTQAVYWGCPAGIGCLHRDFNGGGWSELISVGGYGTYNCLPTMGSGYINAASSGSADYGSGYDLKVWNYDNCVGNTWFVIHSSHSANFSGALAFANDIANSFMIGAF